MTAEGPKTGDMEPKSAQRPARAGERAYRGAVRGFSIVFIAVGLAVLVVTLAHGGGPLSVGVLMGIAFLAVGVGRLWVSSRMGR
jgi:Flp pilus assembly protein TadB